MERKLAAILAADVVAYSALMERDEAGTYERLRSRRQELFEPEVNKHRGRIFKLTGDGVLAEFASVIDAVECAVSVQRGMAERNVAVPEGQRIHLRIGINLGEVIVEGDDRYGEGVNVAVRIEQLADPDGICVSGKVAKEVEGKLAFAFEAMGDQKVKNIAEPIPVYRVKLNGLPVRRIPLRSRKAMWGAVAAVLIVLASCGAWLAYGHFGGTKLAAKPAVAVLPFNNYGGDDETGRLADGLTEDIITDLARFPDFDVVARNSTETYKGKPVDVRQIANALNVNYVLEGSIQHESGRVRITAQLIDAVSGRHLWSDRWDRPDEDVFAVQSEIAQEVTNRLGGGAGLIRKAVRDEAKRKPPHSLTAYEYFLLGDEKLEIGDIESVKQGIPLLEKAVELDPGLARAWASLFHTHNVLSYAGVDPEQNRKLATEAAERAVAADPNDAEAHVALGSAFGIQGDINRAKAEFDTALRLSPGSATVLTQYSDWAATLGEPQKGGEFADQAIRLDPNYPMWAAGRFSYAYFASDRYQDSLRVLQRARPDSYSPDIWIVHSGSLAALGKTQEAKQWAGEALKRFPELTVEGWANQPGYSDRERQRFIKTMTAAGFPACAKSEVLEKLANPFRLPECVNGKSGI